MKKSLTRNQIFEIWYLLKDKHFDSIKLDKRFDYVRNRNIELFSPEVNQIMKARQTNVKKFEEFEQKRKVLLESNSIKDESGNVILDSKGNYKIIENNQQFVQQEYENLVIEYKDALEERQKEADLYNEIVNEEIEVEIAITTFKSFPDLVNSKMTKILKPMIKETDEEIEKMIMDGEV